MSDPAAFQSAALVHSLTAATHPRQKLRRLDPAIQRIYVGLAPGTMLVSLRPGQPRPTSLAASLIEAHQLALAEDDVAVAFGLVGFVTFLRAEGTIPSSRRGCGFAWLADGEILTVLVRAKNGYQAFPPGKPNRSTTRRSRRSTTPCRKWSSRRDVRTGYSPCS